MIHLTMRKRTLLAPVCLLLLGGLIRASGPDPGLPVRPPSKVFPRLYDVRLASHARRALLEDRLLAPLNLGVKVKDGVATLWGPVPSSDIEQKALKTIQGVEGIVAVRSEAYLKKPETHIDLLPPDDRPTRATAALPDRDTGTLRLLEGMAVMLPPPEVGIPGPSGSPRLLPPLERASLEPVPRPQVKADVVKAAAPKVQPRPGPTLAQQVSKLQQTRAVFRQVQVEVQGGIVVIRPGDGPGEYATAFAEEVRKLGGVRQVRIEE